MNRGARSEKHSRVRCGPDEGIESSGSGVGVVDQRATPNQPQEPNPAPGLGMDIIMSFAMCI